MIQLRVRSQNKYNFGPRTDPIVEPVRLMVKPYKMSSPTRDDQTNPEQVVINWIALDAPENGDS